MSLAEKNNFLQLLYLDLTLAIKRISKELANWLILKCLTIKKLYQNETDAAEVLQSCTDHSVRWFQSYRILS